MTEPCDVAIVGGGPAGIAAAIELRRNGIARVVLIEREAETGGIPRHCAHPPFGMREFGRVLTGPRYAARLSDRLVKAGVDVRVRHTVVGLGPAGLLEVASDKGPAQLLASRVILATGARETPRSARLISGARPMGVINTGALQAYVNIEGLLPFRKPLVVGTELVSLSSLATCRSHGIHPVAMIEPQGGPTARAPLMLFPRLVGVPVSYNTELAEILGATRVEAAVIVDRRTGARSVLECDGVLLTGQFVPEASLVRANRLEWDEPTGGPAIDQDGRCSDSAYFAAGNLLRPVETAGWSFQEGRRIGRAVARDLRNPAPAPVRRVPISAGKGLKYVVPQYVSVRAESEKVPPLQLRVTEPLKGHVSLRSGDRMLALASIGSKPERRILFDPAGANVTPEVESLRIEVLR